MLSSLSLTKQNQYFDLKRDKYERTLPESASKKFKLPETHNQGAQRKAYNGWFGLTYHHGFVATSWWEKSAQIHLIITKKQEDVLS